MKVTVLFDGESISSDFETGFGLSLLINETVLFDVGSEGNAVAHNMAVLGVDTQKINAVVLSHEHWDHTDGLPDVLSILNSPDVYVCPSSPEQLKETIVRCGAALKSTYIPTNVMGNIYTTGEVAGVYKDNPMFEQSLVVVEEGNRCILISGCAHYGISAGFGRIRERIAEYICTENFTIDTILGGMHLSHEPESGVLNIMKELKSSGVTKAAPLHCSGKGNRFMFESVLNKGYYDLKVGSTVEI